MRGVLRQAYGLAGKQPTDIRLGLDAAPLEGPSDVV
jgi:hypothetical protein